MATIFFSYRTVDEALAEALKDHLKRLGDNCLLDSDKLAGGDDWRAQLISFLKQSDGLVALFTQSAIERTQYIASEIGMARAFNQTLKEMFIIPVMVGDTEIPPFVSDLMAVRIDDQHSDAALEEASKKIHQSVNSFLKRKVSKRKNSFPRIFISHRHKDELVASALVSL